MTINQTFDNWEIVTDEQDSHIYFREAGGKEVILKDDGSVDFDALDTRRLNDVEEISSASDLPSASGGTITLANKPYHFNGFISVSDSIDISNSPVFIGSHGSVSGLIYTGGGDALVGTDGGFFARDFLFEAPGGTMFNISGDQATEILVESCSFADPANLGNIADFGTIDGFRVPSFKGCNFEDFDAGLTFTGSPDKIFFSESPFRNVSSANVQILKFASGLDVDIIDLTDNYVKGVQSDTEVIYVDPSASITDQFQYRGTTHDTSVTKSNILTGDAAKDKEPYWVSESYPLANSSLFGAYEIDSSGTITISSQANNEDDTSAYEPIDLATSSVGLARFTHSSPNEVTYVGSRDRSIEVTIGVSAETGNSEILSIALFQNGSLVTQSTHKFVVSSTNFGGGTSIAGTGNATALVQDVETNDTFSAHIANLGSSTDIDVAECEVDVLTA